MELVYFFGIFLLMTEAYHYSEPSDPILREIAIPIAIDEIKSPNTQLLNDAMFDLAYPNQGDRSKAVLVGLAAPQIGVRKRLILVDLAADGRGNSGGLQAFINPEILFSSSEMFEGYEGCRSTDRVCGIVERAREVRVRAYTRDGQLVEESVDGFPAVIFQHEVDHLNGIVFVDRVKKEENLHWVEKGEFPLYRKNWRDWPNKVSREDWEKIRNIK